MQIVIEIPEQNYNDICNSERASNYSVLYALDGIRNGTPLPKGHGRLGDLNALAHKMCMADIEHLESESEAVAGLMLRLCNKAPTIIEADKESEGVRNDRL